MPTAADELTLLRAALAAETQRREQAEARAEELQALARVPHLNPNPVVRLGTGGEVLFMNQAARQLWDSLQGHEPVGQWLQQTQAAAQECLRTGTGCQHELSGENYHILLSTVPVPGHDWVMLYAVDISAQRRAEQDARRQREYYEAILNHLPAVVAVLDADQRYEYFSAQGAGIASSAAAVVGLTLHEFSQFSGAPPEVSQRREELFAQARQSRSLVSWEEQWPARDGRLEQYWLCSFQPVFAADGQLRRMMCYALDITQRRRAELRSQQNEVAIQTQQNFTQQVLDTSPSCIFVRDQYDNLVFLNEATRELHTHARHRGAEPLPLDSPEAEEMRRFAQLNAEVLRTGRELVNEDRFTLDNGEVRWFQTVRRLFVRPDGERQILAVSNDITVLKDALKAAEASATARENFLANMSHEIRTPMNGVLGMAGLLAKTALNEQQRGYIDVVQHSGRHLLNVVNDVLDMAKITSGKMDLEQAAFNLCESMGQAVQPLVLQAQEKGIRVLGTMLRDSCPLPWVVGDSYRLNQVLINLVSNAVKFTPKGGTITVGGYFVGETDTTLTTVFRVTDTGIGIAKEKVESIFQEFTQAYADTTRQFGGTGLGLSISRALVEQMGGELSVQSTPGEGSSFSFTTTLPKASPEQMREALAPSAPPDTAVLQGRRVLLVEDNPVNREVAHLLLASHGLEVDEAASGQEALDLFEVQPYDIVLMDIQMPGMNGLEATGRIRQHPDAAKAATPVLALTANAFRSDAEKYRAAGMNDTLPKPFDEAELLAKLTQLIAGTAPGLAELANHPAEPSAEAEPPEEDLLPVLYDLALLRQTAHGSTLFMNRILASFHANTPASLQELQAARAATDWPAAAALAHKLRPSLRLLGAALLDEPVQTLETPDAPAAEHEAAAAALAAGLESLLRELPVSVEA